MHVEQLRMTKNETVFNVFIYFIESNEWKYSSFEGGADWIISSHRKTLLEITITGAFNR